LPLAWATLRKRFAAEREFAAERVSDMTQNESDKGKPGVPGKEADHYKGMVDFDFDLGPSVIICAAAGAVLGLVLAMWGTTEIGIIVATTICFAILSGLFGMFVPWYKPKSR
jgi:hypothetical protein